MARSTPPSDKRNPTPVLDLIEKQKTLYLKQMNQLTHQKVAHKKQPKKHDSLTTELLMDARLFHAEADIKWLTLCESKIKIKHEGKKERG